MVLLRLNSAHSGFRSSRHALIADPETGSGTHWPRTPAGATFSLLCTCMSRSNAHSAYRFELRRVDVTLSVVSAAA